MSSTEPKEKLFRKRLGEIPLLQAVERRLGLKAILKRYFKGHGNTKIPVEETLMLLAFNIAVNRRPLYELESWIGKLDSGLLNIEKDLFDETTLSSLKGLFNDDRFGRVLEQLFMADRASLTTEIASCVVRKTGVSLNQLHNDSTSVKSFGKMLRKSATGLFFTQGHSKDHRPDLKQIVYSLTISADGAVPIHFKAYPGNRSDDTTHIETWDTLCKISGKTNFLYVADSKVCTDKQLSYITKQGGRVVTVMPNTWKEATLFKEGQRENPRSKQCILRKPRKGRVEGESFYRIAGEYTTSKGGYTLHWIYSTGKKKRDLESRSNRLKKVESELTELSNKINYRNLKTRDQIEQCVEKLLEDYDASKFYGIEVNEVKIKKTVQIGSGRPSKKTKYKTHIEIIYTLSWTRNAEALNKGKNIDGIFPLLCTDTNMTAKEVLVAYKYQPNIEKRFRQLKDIHRVAPTLFKRIERVEAILLLFYLALIMQAVIERGVRKNMKKRGLDALPLYPDHKLSYHPTTAKIFDQFQDVTVSYLMREGELVKEYRDELSKTQKDILELLNISEENYWKSTGYVRL